jgi:hypothetical protein
LALRFQRQRPAKNRTKLVPIVNLVANASIDSTAHIVQVALTPIFLLTGAGTLRNVFNARLARVSDHHGI